MFVVSDSSTVQDSGVVGHLLGESLCRSIYGDEIPRHPDRRMGEPRRGHLCLPRDFARGQHDLGIHAAALRSRHLGGRHTRGRRPLGIAADLARLG